jgi:hypothetical protein
MRMSYGFARIKFLLHSLRVVQHASPLNGKHASHDPYFDRADSLFEWGKLMSAHSIAYAPLCNVNL